MTSPGALIYLDHLATTPCAPEVVAAMCEALEREYGNPSSPHALGWRARERVEEARGEVGALLGVRPQRLTLTSGATEASHIALFGAAALAEQAGERAHIVSQRTEHSATLGPLRELERRGHALTLVGLTSGGIVDLDALSAAITPQTRLVSLLRAHNELGTLQPIAEVAALVRQRAHPECLLHVDAAQSVGKERLSLSALDVDLLSLSAHKFYGPKGAGALYVRQDPRRPRLELPPSLWGGGQERGLRPGTVATHQAVGLGVAARLAREALEAGEPDALSPLTERLRSGLEGRGARLNCATSPRLPHALSLTCPPALFERLSGAWGGRVMFSQGAACQSGRGAPSAALLEIGLTSEEASRVVRLSVGRYTSAAEVERALALIDEVAS
jgi:cysteine desulfurase